MRAMGMMVLLATTSCAVMYPNRKDNTYAVLDAVGAVACAGAATAVTGVYTARAGHSPWVTGADAPATIGVITLVGAAALYAFSSLAWFDHNSAKAEALSVARGSAASAFAVP